MTTRKLPIGIQDFECIRTDGYVYVDKTAYVYRLASEGKPYFLGRPRRFGKSLLLSTLKYYFEGRRELFDGLAMAELEKEWARHPVFHIDMNVGQYDSLDELKASLASRLRVLEDEWEVEAPDKLLSSRFENLIRGVAEKAGRRVVVLIDEYDKPLLKNLDDGPIQKSFLDVLKGFYGVLKSADQWLRFVFITGVTKFSHVSIFSDLNQLRDISMDKAFAGVCGISEAELAGSFAPEIRGLADDAAMTAEEARAEMRKRYDGYRFAPEAETVYNPFSVLNTFADRRFGYYWFRTGTPTFLVEQLRDTRFHVPDFTGGVSVYAQRIDDYRAKGDDPVPLLYQTGYLTIKDYEPRTGRYTLGFPNEEVKYAFLGELLDSYVPKGSNLKRLF
ncbi:MAG: AAA family ATPase, partial [Acidobacteriota bacterium]|nr:AAA family ATPase [Acidobacteriota bacterium]